MKLDEERGVSSRKRAWLMLFAGGGLAALLALPHFERQGGAQEPPAAQVPTALLVRGRLEPAEGVLALGAFSSAPTVALGDVQAREGTQVAAGEILATLQNRARAEAEAAAARAALDLAERRLDQVRQPWREASLRALTAAVEARRAELDIAQQQMRRTADLQRAGVRADAERDTREAEMRRAASLLREAEAQLAAATNVSEREVRVAEAEVALARARLASAEAEAELSLIRAPRAGTVLRVHAHPGEPVGNRTILELADMTRLKAVAEVDERLLPQIRPGGEARIAPRGAARDWPGVVARIGGVVRTDGRVPAEAATGRGSRFVDVEIALPEPAGLPPVAGLELLIRLSPP